MGEYDFVCEKRQRNLFVRLLISKTGATTEL